MMPKSGHFTPGMQVNSQHQIWSHWKFVVEADPLKLPTVRECRENASRFFAKLFNTRAGRIRVFRNSAVLYTFELQIEGPPAHDPDCQLTAKRKFIGDFMFKGFGYGSSLVGYEVKVLSGESEQGKPSDQLLVVPSFSTLR